MGRVVRRSRCIRGSARRTSDRRRLSGCHFFLDSNLAAIVSALTAYTVVYVPCAAVGADGECGHHSLVVSSTLCGTCLRLFTFRMCHFILSFLFVYHCMSAGAASPLVSGLTAVPATVCHCHSLSPLSLMLSAMSSISSMRRFSRSASSSLTAVSHEWRLSRALICLLH